MLFLHGNVHQETVNRALRILVQLLSDSTLLQRFHEGDIFGGWVYGFERRTCTDIPFSASFDLETLDSHFPIGELLSDGTTGQDLSQRSVHPAGYDSSVNSSGM